MIYVDKDIIVSIRYIMKNDRGEILENRMNEPTSYLHGSAGILPLLQAQLKGLKAGDKKLVYLKKDSGLTDDDFTFEIVIDGLRNALPEELLLGYPVLLCDADCECYKNEIS